MFFNFLSNNSNNTELDPIITCIIIIFCLIVLLITFIIKLALRIRKLEEKNN